MSSGTGLVHQQWCEHCQVPVPEKRADVDRRVVKAVAGLVFGGLFSCGITWLLIPVALIMIPASRRQLCPVCQRKTVMRAAS